MNVLTFDDVAGKAAHYLRATLRFLDPVRRVGAFSSEGEDGAIGRIYAINLDRKPLRWRRTRSELHRFRDRQGHPLDLLTRRFSAIDARYMADMPSEGVLRTNFTLAEQLAINPNPLIEIDDKARSREIQMTKPEIAIALSHIEVWRQIAAGEVEYSLVVEDDVMMRPGFARRLNREWPAVSQNEVDLLYLAYRDVNDAPTDLGKHRPARRTQPGLWEASAYVLNRGGAQKLLALLPAHGPIDLWLNFILDDLRVFTTTRPVMEQRLSEPSTNSYSVLPVLSQVGVVTRERPLIPSAHRLPNPIIAVGVEGSGISSLGLALSMLGYRVVSDLDSLPPLEQKLLEAGRGSRVFGAYVNVGSIQLETAAQNPNARFISTDPINPSTLPTDRTLRLTPDIVDKWGNLTDFLGLEYPSYPYPNERDQGLRGYQTPTPEIARQTRTHNLRWDRSPWIVPRSRKPWSGISIKWPRVKHGWPITWSRGDVLDSGQWYAREDTFPSNLALFSTANVIIDDVISLTLDKKKTAVREYMAGAIAQRSPQLYGTYSVEMRPARGSGVITGLFLHRNGPRQEIDIEFRGRNTTTMLVNVFYNPGPIGTKLEYGYRGTPTEIDLGFDAADDFHLYEIDWQRGSITWKVDGHVVYSRAIWDPTPIPDRPLEFNINIWTSRSVEFAGPIDPKSFPFTTTIQRIRIG